MLCILLRGKVSPIWASQQSVRECYHLVYRCLTQRSWSGLSPGHSAEELSREYFGIHPIPTELRPSHSVPESALKKWPHSAPFNFPVSLIRNVSRVALIKT